jgi:glycine/D-amino acid oxidase-like deaminating enzyme
MPGDLDADVAIVGAGFTGLWTAYYLASGNPGLRVVVVEKAFSGFGASGRNGGWCSALFPASPDRVARLPGSDRSSASRLYSAMRAAVDEVGKVAAAEGIDAHFVKGGTVSVIRSPAQLRRARAEIAHARAWGRGPDDLVLLDAAQTRARFAVPGALGATFAPNCARIQPVRLVRGLARAVERRGVAIYEQTTATAIRPGEVRTDRGIVRAGAVIRATEGYTPGIDGLRRAVVPVYSLVIATEPLSEDRWEQVGLREYETFTDHRHLIIYGQRTADGRVVFGGRGAPYHFASRVRPDYDQDTKVFGRLERTLVDLLPVLRGVRVTHRWGGPLGIARDWVASVGFDRRTGLGWAGGYVGDGVATSNLAGRTLADLVADTGSSLTRLPWVGHRSRRWEPEPLRWLGVNAGLKAMTAADVEERLTRRPSVVAHLMAPLTGGR